jgi:hypothetical protein
MAETPWAGQLTALQESLGIIYQLPKGTQYSLTVTDLDTKNSPGTLNIYVKDAEGRLAIRNIVGKAILEEGPGWESYRYKLVHDSPLKVVPLMVSVCEDVGTLFCNKSPEWDQPASFDEERDSSGRVNALGKVRKTPIDGTEYEDDEQ